MKKISLLITAFLLSAASFAEGNFIIENGVLIQYVGNERRVVIPEGVTKIGHHAFYNKDSINSISIPASVVAFEEEPFADCLILQLFVVAWEEPTVFLSNLNIFDALPGSVILYIPSGKKAAYSAHGLGSKFWFREYNELGNRLAESGVYWREGNDSTLVISGEGEMPHFWGQGDEYEHASWIFISDFNYQTIKSIVINEGVTTVGDGAFTAFNNVTSISLPNSMTGIGIYAFQGCTSLHHIELPDSVKSIGRVAFSTCRNLESVKFSASLESIGEYAFQQCEKLISIELPNSLVTLELGAFQSCEKMESVKMSNSLENIGSTAFCSCKMLSSIEIPQSVKTIGADAFAGCNSLRIVTVEWQEPLDSIQYVFNSVPVSSCVLRVPLGTKAKYAQADTWKDFNIQEYGELGNRLADSDIYWKIINDTVLVLSGKGDIPHFSGVNELNYYYATWWQFKEIEMVKSVIIEDGITSIGNSAFAAFVFNNESVHFEIPNSVTHIGNWAFQNRKSLTHIKLPNSVKYIGECAFQACSNLEFIESSDSLVDIGRYAFQSCEKLTSFKLPDSFKSIGVGVFSNCKSFVSFELPDSLQSIQSVAFSMCENLTSITIPQSVKEIRGDVFSGCNNLKYLYYNVTKMDSVDCCWTGNHLTSIIIGSNVKSLPQNAFLANYELTSVKIPGSVESIGNWAFAYCELKEITVEWQVPLAIDSAQGIFDKVPVSSCVLKVPAGTAEAYSKAAVWKDFIIEEYGEKVTVDPEEESVYFSWLPNEDAAGYVLTIYKDKDCTEVLYTFYFDAEGQLLRSAGIFSYTVNALESGTTYYYSLTTLNDNNQPIEVLRGQFATEGGTVNLPEVSVENIIVYVDNKTIVIENIENSIINIYNATGQMVAGHKAMNATVRIPVSQTGIYIVNVDGKAQKVLVR